MNFMERNFGRNPGQEPADEPSKKSARDALSSLMVEIENIEAHREDETFSEEDELRIKNYKALINKIVLEQQGVKVISQSEAKKIEDELNNALTSVRSYIENTWPPEPPESGDSER